MINNLKETACIKFYNLQENGKRILFLGNSMTLHGVNTDIGWYSEHGMAASCAEKDYVHLTMSEIEKSYADTSFCVCQISQWETNYKTPESVLHNFVNAKKFNADIIIFRAIENCPSKDFDKQVFKKSLSDLLEYFSSKNTKIILSTGFWRHIGDEAIEEFSQEKNLPLVLLGDIGDRDEMRALGLFEHKGVANHPGDLGMQYMADRILTEIKKCYI